MDGAGPLGDFLQARRARLRPEDVGLRDVGPRRRVAGLRREELAQLAGVSACRDLYADWRRKARAVVGNLRIAVGRHPEDPLLAELIGELTMKSPEFVALWRDHRVAPCDAASYELHHPVVGALTVTQQTLAIARSPGQSLIVCTTPAGSPSEQALVLLRQAGARPAPVPVSW